MGFYVLLLKEKLPPAEVASLLGRLFAIDAGTVAEVASVTPGELYYELRLLRQAVAPRDKVPGASFFVELSVYPHGHATRYQSEWAFAQQFSQLSQRPVLVSAQNKQDPYRWLLLDNHACYQVEEWPEEEHTAAITVTAENTIRLESSCSSLGPDELAGQPSAQKG